MSVCLYVCMYVCMHVCLYGWMYLCMHECVSGAGSSRSLSPSGRAAAPVPALPLSKTADGTPHASFCESGPCRALSLPLQLVLWSASRSKTPPERELLNSDDFRKMLDKVLQSNPSIVYVEDPFAWVREQSLQICKNLRFVPQF